jgi:hypothetical protein
MWVLKASCCKLLAAKYKMKTQAQVYKKFGKSLRIPSLKDKERPLSFVKPSYKISLKFNIKSTPDLSSRNVVKISTASLEGLRCINCGSNYRVEMHHIRKMKDLNPKISRVDKLRSRINRKQIPLCRSCHLAKHRYEL